MNGYPLQVIVIDLARFAPNDESKFIDIVISISFLAASQPMAFQKFGRKDPTLQQLCSVCYEDRDPGKGTSESAQRLRGRVIELESPTLLFGVEKH